MIKNIKTIYIQISVILLIFLKISLVNAIDKPDFSELAEAQRDGDILRGQGDAEKNKILGKAFSQDPEFFSFYRSMQAYSRALSEGDTTMVLSPKSDFFEFFGRTNGTK